MNTDVELAQIEPGYQGLDKVGISRVNGPEGQARAVEIQTFDDEANEIEMEGWSGLALNGSEPSEESTGPMEGGGCDDSGDEEAQIISRYRTASLQPLSLAVLLEEEWVENTMEGAAD